MMTEERGRWGFLTHERIQLSLSAWAPKLYLMPTVAKWSALTEGETLGMKEENRKKPSDHVDNATLNSNSITIFTNLAILNGHSHYIFSQINDEMTN